MSFNKLTAAEGERLALLLEEMGEALQMIGKIQRHGYESHHPDGVITNRFELARELGQVRYAIELLCAAADLNRLSVLGSARDKSMDVRRWLHHQNNGLLDRASEMFEP